MISIHLSFHGAELSYCAQVYKHIAVMWISSILRHVKSFFLLLFLAEEIQGLQIQPF